MIPLMTTEPAGKASMNEASAPPVSSGEAAVAFGDVLTLILDDTAAIADAAVLAGDAEFATEMPDDAGLLAGQPPDVKKEAATPLTFGLAEQSSSIKVGGDQNTTALAKQQSIVEPPTVGDRKVLADGVKAPIDGPVAKDSIAQPQRPSFAQSAIESQLPDENNNLMRPEKAQDVKTDTPLLPAKGNGERPMVPASGTSAARVDVPDMQGAKVAVPQDRSTAREGSRRDAQDQRAAQSIPAGAPAPTAAQVPTTQSPAVALAQSILAEKFHTHDLQNKASDGEFLFAVGGGERATTTVPAATVSMLSGGTELARQAATQIAVAVNASTGKATEIALNPEELGRVRLSMTTGDSMITLHLSAERPETHELLRRHIDVLAQEFKALGYDTISFSFGAEGGEGHQDQQSDDRDGQHRTDTSENPAPQGQRPATASPGLDLLI